MKKKTLFTPKYTPLILSAFDQLNPKGWSALLRHAPIHKPLHFSPQTRGRIAETIPTYFQFHERPQ